MHWRSGPSYIESTEAVVFEVDGVIISQCLVGPYGQSSVCPGLDLFPQHAAGILGTGEAATAPHFAETVRVEQLALRLNDVESHLHLGAQTRVESV